MLWSSPSTVSPTAIRRVHRPGMTATPTSTATASLDEVRAAAIAAVGAGARIIELEPEPAGQVAWEATVLAVNGATFTVLLSPTAEVLYLARKT